MPKKNVFIFSTALLIILLDQLTKLLIKANFELNQSLPIIKDFLHLTYTTNTGSAFGLLKGFNAILVLFSVIVIIAIIYFTRKIKENEKALQFSVGLLLGGTIGNLIDRVLYGKVVDFIDLQIWPVFNMADSAVTISVVILIILLWRK